MAYPEKVLAEDEQIVEHLHPHWITLVPATIWFLVFCAAGGAGIALVANHTDGTTQSVLIIVIVVVALGLISWLSFAPWISWRTTHYVFTTHRVLIRRGVLRHEGRDIALQRISDVGFSRSLWDRVVGSGTLTIESAGERGQETLTNVPHSDQAQQTLNHLIEKDGERRAYGAAHGFQSGPPAGYQQSQPGFPQGQPGYPPGYQQGNQPPPAGYQQYPPTSPYPPQ
jgi:membrane protein YdbS with pleckstrin-like domain